MNTIRPSNSIKNEIKYKETQQNSFKNDLIKSQKVFYKKKQNSEQPPLKTSKTSPKPRKTKSKRKSKKTEFVKKLKKSTTKVVYETVYHRVNEDGQPEKKVKKEVREEVITVYEDPNSVSDIVDDCNTSLTKTAENSRMKARNALSATSSETSCSRFTRPQDFEDLAGLKKNRLRVNSADAEVINTIQDGEEIDKKVRRGSSDFIKVSNNFNLIEEKMPNMVKSGKFSKNKENKKIEIPKVQKKNRRFQTLRKIEECPEEMEDNENCCEVPKPKKRKRRTRSSRWIETVKGVKSPDRENNQEENQRTLKLLKQFQKNKIEIKTGIILEEEEDIQSEDEEDLTQPFPKPIREENISVFAKKRKESSKMRDTVEIKPSHKKTLSLVVNPGSLKIKKSRNVIREQTPGRLTFCSTGLLFEKSTQKKKKSGGGDFLSDSQETQKEKEFIDEGVQRKLFKARSQDIKFKKKEKKNDFILTQFDFKVEREKRMGRKLGVEEETGNENSLLSECHFVDKKILEKMKDYTRSSPKIGEIVEEDEKIKKMREKENLRKIRLRLQKLRINPSKINTPKMISGRAKSRKKANLKDFSRDTIKGILSKLSPKKSHLSFYNNAKNKKERKQK